jgi:hypothetical protein
MPDLYNITNITIQGTPADMIFAINNELNGALIFGILALVFFGILLIFSGAYDFNKVLLLDFFAMTLICGVMWLMGLLSWGYTIIPLIGLAFTLIAAMLQQAQN